MEAVFKELEGGAVNLIVNVVKILRIWGRCVYYINQQSIQVVILKIRGRCMYMYRGDVIYIYI